MEWARIGGVAAVGLTALLILRAYKPEWAPMLRIAVTVIAVGLTLSMAVTALSYAQELAVGLGTPDGEGWSILLKALGVAFLTEVSASVCRDSGESGLATWVETAGKLEILLLSFPLIRAVMDTVGALVSGG
jgi:stage III sporulation protein AD